MQHRARIFLEGLHIDGFMTLLLPWYNHMMRGVALKRILSAALYRSTADTSGLCARFATAIAICINAGEWWIASVPV